MHGWRSPSEWTLWVWASLVSIIAGLFVLVAVWIRGDTAFQPAFFSNFLATLAGFLLGVPVAIWLTVRQNQEQRHATSIEAARRQADVLSAIRTEMVENRKTLTVDRRDHAGKRIFAAPFPMDEVWSAMSDGGQLEWIVDAELLRRLARAYVFIRTIIYLEKQWFEAAHFPGLVALPPDSSLSPGSRITQYLEHQDRVCIDAIDEALDLVNAVLTRTSDAQVSD
jgi:hypothetical protein